MANRARICSCRIPTPYFYALQFKKMMLFPCVNLMSFYAFGNQAVKPCRKHFPRVCMSVIIYVYAKGCLLQAKS